MKKLLSITIILLLTMIISAQEYSLTNGAYDNKVLLSSFTNWHNVLNQWPLTNWKRIDKKTNLLERETGTQIVNRVNSLHFLLESFDFS